MSWILTSKAKTMSERKTKIMDAAAALFKEKGYAASSMREIAERVGLEPSSLYNHIHSKSEILKDICMVNAALFVDGITCIREEGGSSTEQLSKLIQLHVDIATARGSSITVFNDEWRHLDSESLGEFLKMRKFYEKSLRSILEEGIRCGEIRDCNVQVMLLSIISSLRWVHEYYRPEKMGNPQSLGCAFADLWLNGLSK